MKNTQTKYAHIYLPYAIGMWHTSIKSAQLSAGIENSNLFFCAELNAGEVVSLSVVDENNQVCKQVKFLNRVFWVPLEIQYIQLVDKQIFASKVFNRPSKILGCGLADVTAWVEC